MMFLKKALAWILKPAPLYRLSAMTTAGHKVWLAAADSPLLVTRFQDDSRVFQLPSKPMHRYVAILLAQGYRDVKIERAT